MSNPEDLTPVVRSWLQDQAGPLSSDVREWVVERVPMTAQRRTWWPGVRSPFVRPSRLAAAAALILVVAGGVGLLPRPDHQAGGGGLPSPSPRPTQDASPPPVRYSGEPPGRFSMSEPNTDGVGTWPVDVFVTVPQGWELRSGLRGGGLWRRTADSANPALATLEFGRPGALLAGPDTCPARTELPAGRNVDDLAGALSAIPGVEHADAAIQGYQGKQVEFTIPDPSPDCKVPSGWSTPSGGEAWSYGWEPGWHHQLLILDIDGVRFLVDAGYRADAPPEVRAELQAMVNSIELRAGSSVPAATAPAPTS